MRSHLTSSTACSAPNDFVIATSSWFVRSEEQREVIWNFEAIELQPHAAVGEVFNETGTFFARPTQDRCYASKLVARCPAPLRHTAKTCVAVELWRSPVGKSN